MSWGVHLGRGVYTAYGTLQTIQLSVLINPRAEEGGDGCGSEVVVVGGGGNKVLSSSRQDAAAVGQSIYAGR